MQTLLASPYRIKQKRTLRWRRASTQRYPGQLYDVESGLHYNYFRDYEAATGRYVESDPIGLRGGNNTYSYVRSAPLTSFDKFGLIDINYFPDNWYDWNDISDKADNRNTGPNTIGVGAHASPSGPEDANGNFIPVDELAKRIRRDPKYGRGAKVVELDACNLGGSKYAQELANKINLPVVAPGAYVFFRKDGSVFIADARLEGSRLVPVENASRRWVLSYPGRTTPIPLPGWRP